MSIACFSEEFYKLKYCSTVVYMVPRAAKNLNKLLHSQLFESNMGSVVSIKTALNSAQKCLIQEH